MLVITRRPLQSIYMQIGDVKIRVGVFSVKGKYVRLTIDAPGVSVRRDGFLEEPEGPQRYVAGQKNKTQSASLSVIEP